MRRPRAIDPDDVLRAIQAHQPVSAKMLNRAVLGYHASSAISEPMMAAIRKLRAQGKITLDSVRHGRNVRTVYRARVG